MQANPKSIQEPATAYSVYSIYPFIRNKKDVAVIWFAKNRKGNPPVSYKKLTAFPEDENIQEAIKELFTLNEAITLRDLLIASSKRSIKILIKESGIFLKGGLPIIKREIKENNTFVFPPADADIKNCFSFDVAGYYDLANHLDVKPGDIKYPIGEDRESDWMILR